MSIAIDNKIRPVTKRYRAMVLTEVIITAAISLVIAMAVGMLVIGGNHAWHSTFDSINGKLQTDSIAVMTAFGNIGRKSNRLSYRLYNTNKGSLSVAEPQFKGSEEVVSGNAVEFKYWDVELDKADSHTVVDVSKLATAYALFYIDGNKLKVDYGPYPPGAISPTVKSGARNTSGVKTVVLAENVYPDSDCEAGIFSHTTINGVGQGCVRINCILKDPETEKSIKITTATLLRNIWPR